MDLRKTTIVAAVAAGTLAAYSPASAKTRLLFNIFVPPKHLIRAAIADGWIKRVEAASKGQIKVRVPGKTLAPAPRQWGMVTDGIADVTIMYNVFERRRLTLIQMSYLPFNVPSAKSAGIALWRTHKKHFEQANQFKGVKLLGFFYLPPGAIHSLGKPIAKASDFQGLKVRVSPGTPAKFAEAMGGVPVPTPGIKAYEVVSKGVVDAMLFPPSDTYSLKMVPFVKHTVLVPGGAYGASFSLFMNQKKFDGLTKAEQAAIMAASGEKVGESAKAFDAQNPVGIKALEDQGSTVKTADAAFMAALDKQLAPIRAEWIAEAKKAGVDGAAAVKYYIEEGRKLATTK